PGSELGERERREQCGAAEIALELVLADGRQPLGRQLTEVRLTPGRQVQLPLEQPTEIAATPTQFVECAAVQLDRLGLPAQVDERLAILESAFASLLDVVGRLDREPEVLDGGALVGMHLRGSE